MTAEAAAGMEQEVQRCLLFYGASRFGGLGSSVFAFLEKLRQFAGGSVKGCKTRSLKEALQILDRMCKGFWELSDEDALPLLECLLAFQLSSASSSCCFQKLEKIIIKLAEGKENLCSREMKKLLRAQIEDKEILLAGDLEAVCMFLQESDPARAFLGQILPTLLLKVAATFQRVLQDEMAKDFVWEQLIVKMCLQMFQMMPDLIRPLVWSRAESSEALQRILGCLLQVLMGKTGPSSDLAGTAVSMLVNSTPAAEGGAQAVRNLFQLFHRDVGEVAFGKLILSTRAHPEDGLQTLELIRGLLACSRKDILSCAQSGSLGQGCLLLDVLFPDLSSLCQEKNSCRYRCLPVLALWLQRLKECAVDAWRVREKRLLTGHSELLQKLSQLSWFSAERLADGVSVGVFEAFERLLEIYLLECQHFGDLAQPLFQQFLQKILGIPWQMKVRYPALCALLPYVGTEVVLDVYRELPQHLLLCLSTNYLCPSAAELYKTFLELQRRRWMESIATISEDELAWLWAQRWLPTLSEALASPDSFLQSNAATYLLAPTLRSFPAAYPLLAEGIQGMDSAPLRAWVTLLSARKMTSGVVPSDGETLQKLSLCIHSEDEAVRLATLSVLCRSPRTNQMLSEVELQLLQKFLPLNLSCDSSGFRQALQALLKKALVRQRNSSLALLRSLEEQTARDGGRAAAERTLSRGIDFVQWLLELSISSLTPGSNFQRKKTALLLLQAILETCTDSWSPERKKGQPPQHMVGLLDYAREKGCWDFFSTSNLLVLLSCCRDRTNEIRELAAELLVQYFPSAFPEFLVQAVFDYAEESICSPRVQEAEAGALLMKTLLQRSDRSTLRRLFPQEAELALCCSGLCYAQHLLRMLKDQYAIARQDLLQAAKERPMHGVILALRRCLLEVPEVVASMVKAEHTSHWKGFLDSLVRSLKGISDFLLWILHGAQGTSSERPVAAPSMADMGNAINVLISQGGGLERSLGMDGEDPVLLSEEHGLLMTCCWVSLKEVGLLLGSLVEKILSLVPPPAGPLLPVATLEMVAGIFQDTLLRCRHWGVVEGCSSGLARFCASLLRHPDPAMQVLPRHMLTQALALLQGPRSSSLTRRAAGFPMLILGIVSGEDMLASRPLLKDSIQVLLGLGSTPLPANWDQTLDLPQISAIHVLQVLVWRSRLGPELLPLTTPTMVLALRSLGSPCWAMRNAALQLFSSFSAQLLGQTLSQEDSFTRSTLTPQAFFTQYPQLRDVLLRELHQALESCDPSQKGTFHLCPSLHSVLTLLAKLQPGADDPPSGASRFLEPLIRLAGSPVYAIRVMAARALVSLASVTEYEDLLRQLIGDLSTIGSAISHNALHGRLLQVEAVLAETLQGTRLSMDALRSLTLELEEQFWLVAPVQRCPLIRAAYLRVILLLTECCTQDFRRRLRELLYVETLALPCGLKVGSAVFRQLAAHFLCTEAASPERYAHVCQLLTGGDPDMRLAVLSWVMEHDDGRMDEGLEAAVRRTLQEELLSVLRVVRSNEFLTRFLQAYVSLHHACPPPQPSTSVQASVRLLLSLLESGSSGPDLQSHALCVVSLLLLQGQELEDLSLLERWSRVLVLCSDPCSSEPLRTAAARALRLAGARVVQRALSCASSSSLSILAVRVIGVGIKLLQDGDKGVRKEASAFATLTPQLLREAPTDCAPVQSSRGLEDLLELLLQRFWDSAETLQLCLQHLPSEDLSSVLMDLKKSRAASLYEQDEPNVSSEPAVFACILLPFLLQLLERIPTSAELRARLECWVKDTGASIVYQVQCCRQWWSQDGDSLSVLKVLSSAKVCTTVAVLLVKAEFLSRTLAALESCGTPALEICCTSHDLGQELKLLQALLAQHGLCPPVLCYRAQQPDPPPGLCCRSAEGQVTGMPARILQQ
ncbi:thyroid adenoma-associated protein homolog isoform X2 [Rhinatrema bivittatum]|uniref:thyroid adenoma-associated protein homolog isoform X2 n=1 Tax=Rhinatrema bivittatum TaxID=194408 RepID=UPI00112A6216|nr:thyroid adenoma-associated protein homolog isoform X2 [Rhinatrema bivittatum]